MACVTFYKDVTLSFITDIGHIHTTPSSKGTVFIFYELYSNGLSTAILIRKLF